MILKVEFLVPTSKLWSLFPFASNNAIGRSDFSQNCEGGKLHDVVLDVNF